MAGRKSDFTLTKLDDLFTTQAQRDEEQLSKIRDIPLELIDDFPDHPFKVRDDEDMMQLVESVKERGVITPATVRQKEDGRYELVSGHRRKRACELAGFETLRSEIVDLNRDEATILMVESNFQRSEILPSEKAFAYKMRLEAMKRQGQRTDLTSTPLVEKLAGKDALSVSRIGEEVGESREQIRRYIRLTNLVPELLEFVDEGRIKMRPAVELSYLDEDFLKSDIKRFYNYLVDERGLKPATVDGVHNILHQIFDMAVDDNYIRNNPTNNVLRELKKAHCFKTEKRRGLTRPEQELFMDYLKNSNTAVYWYPVFAVMLGTGLRVGEVTGLRWCDIDLEDGIIDVNHTLVYYDHRTSEGKKGCYFNVNTPKTEAGNRQVPMLDFVKEAFVMEKERQELLGVHCEATIDGYTDFIFLNRFGQPQHQSTLNKAIRRIIRDCNDEQFLKTENPEVLLPHFSCHSLRHTFTTRMCEAGVNIKVIQDTLGHKDITTTLNIYTDVTKELKRTEFDGLDKYFNNSIA